jgi:serine/threonine protein kinase
VDTDPTKIPEQLPPATTLLSFRIGYLYASGGMGDVYRAFDESLRREVALKRLKKEWADDTTYRTKFQREAEITGFLEHPGIVPVHHLSVTDGDQPFYLMRFIQGEDFDFFLRKLRKNVSASAAGRPHDWLREPLRVLIDVCRTIQFAHQRGVIHRDLKPKNVMIDSSGNTLVVDWGLAKILDRADKEFRTRNAPTELLHDVGLTRDGDVLGTVPYMSPEQATGRTDLEAATDIFALGAILYEIVAGQHPYHTPGSKTVQMGRVQQADFNPLCEICPQAPPPLVSIVDKAMQRQPQDRYVSAGELADDLQRWLDDEPVSAHRESRYETLTRWIRRNERTVVTTHLALLLLAMTFIVATVVIVISWRMVSAARNEEARQRRIAEEEQIKTADAKAAAELFFRREREAVDTWLTSAADVMQHYPGIQKAREQMLLKAAEHYQKFAEGEFTDPGLERERGNNLLRLGDTYALLNKTQDAEQAYRNSEEVYGELLDRDSDVDLRVLWAQARLKRSLVMAARNELAPARALLGETRAALSGDDAHLREIHAFYLVNEGKLLAEVGQLDEGLQFISRGREAFGNLVDENLELPRVRFALHGTQSLQGEILVALGRVAEAREQLEGAITGFAAMRKSRRDDPEVLRKLTDTRIALAIASRAAGDREQEGVQYAAALREYMDLVEAQPDVPVYAENKGLAHTDYAQALTEAGQLEEAISQLQEALKTFRKLRAKDPGMPRYREGLAAAADALGDALRDQGNFVDSHTILSEAVDVLDELVKEFGHVAPYQVRLGVALSHRAQVREMLADDEHATADFERAISVMHGIATPSEVGQNALANMHWYYGEFLLRLKRRDAALQQFAAARDIWLRLADEMATPETLVWQARFLTLCSEESFRDAKAAEKLAATLATASPGNADYVLLLAQTQHRAGDTGAGLQTLASLAKLRQSPQPRDLYTRALLQWQAGKDEEAEKSFQAGEQLHKLHQSGRRENRALRSEFLEISGKMTENSPDLPQRK